MGKENKNYFRRVHVTEVLEAMGYIEPDDVTKAIDLNWKSKYNQKRNFTDAAKFLNTNTY